MRTVLGRQILRLCEKGGRECKKEKIMAFPMQKKYRMDKGG